MRLKWENHCTSKVKEPFNFKRTGCLGCPFNIELKAELTKLLEYSPKQAKTAYTIWKPVYDEYARLNYRISHQLLERIVDKH